MAIAAKAPSGRGIWRAVRDELMLNLYPMPLTTLAPTGYHVYLHPEDFDAIAAVAPRIVSQVQQALSAEVEGINQGSQPARRVLARFPARENIAPIEVPAAGWQVHLQADHNGELERGQLGIVSTLAMPPSEYAGTPTTTIVKAVVGAGHRRSSKTEVISSLALVFGMLPQVAAVKPAEAPSTATASGTSAHSRDRARLIQEEEQRRPAIPSEADFLQLGELGSDSVIELDASVDSDACQYALTMLANYYRECGGIRLSAAVHGE